MTKPDWGALVDLLAGLLADERAWHRDAEARIAGLQQDVARAKLTVGRTAVSTAVVTLRDDLHITDPEGRVLVIVYGDGRVMLDPAVAADTIAAQFWRQIGAYRQRPGP